MVTASRRLLCTSCRAGTFCIYFVYIVSSKHVLHLVHLGRKWAAKAPPCGQSSNMKKGTLPPETRKAKAQIRKAKTKTAGKNFKAQKSQESRRPKISKNSNVRKRLNRHEAQIRKSCTDKILAEIRRHPTLAGARQCLIHVFAWVGRCVA